MFIFKNGFRIRFGEKKGDKGCLNHNNLRFIVGLNENAVFSCFPGYQFLHPAEDCDTDVERGGYHTRIHSHAHHAISHTTTTACLPGGPRPQRGEGGGGTS